MAFKSTQKRTTDQIVFEIKSLGGSFFASSGCNMIVYQAASYPSNLHHHSL
ncbi:uncharacterized protein MELLADRAFT_96049 [Melampsora larici-populina 98AG31]|uniref:Peptidase M16 N-terminal domain-containing protein n=1 Tax=Melampsora larici-populina (strain 98AG31 / pathotype 3-4-7) TaxID=747676 RepID=F4SAR9_MELLP|nr:uncharacterized protein MELLADRAFT_96049 [Melampsora larici-populina 98AG31]EGF98264.1 hypothetical protein MELLADRAFT_96049 [Melampsora larici-populina 98AG31]